MTDVAIFQTDDGGDITVTNGVFLMDDGLVGAVYLSLFGSNEDDSGSDGDKPKEWWANKEITDEAQRQRGELQFLLNTLPLTPGNLKRFEDAATHDLAWFVESKTATFVSVIARIPALNTLRLEVSVEIDGKKYPRDFDWPTSK